MTGASGWPHVQSGAVTGEGLAEDMLTLLATGPAQPLRKRAWWPRARLAAAVILGVGAIAFTTAVVASPWRFTPGASVLVALIWLASPLAALVIARSLPWSAARLAGTIVVVVGTLPVLLALLVWVVVSANESISGGEEVGSYEGTVVLRRHIVPAETNYDPAEREYDVIWLERRWGPLVQREFVNDVLGGPVTVDDDRITYCRWLWTGEPDQDPRESRIVERFDPVTLEHEIIESSEYC